MNQFSDHGLVISVRPHGENGAILTILSESHGKCAGYVNGAQSSQRLKSVLQLGNRISVEWQSKGDNQLGRFDCELEHDITAAILDDPKKILAIQSLCGLLTSFLGDREPYSALFNGTKTFLDLLPHDGWAALYVSWEMSFLRELGYGIDLSQCALTGVTEGLTHISPKTGRAVCEIEAQPYRHKLIEMPAFLQGKEIEDDDIEKGLKMTEYFLVHRILQHSSYQSLPEARIRFQDQFL